jgi:formylglycine-generating enzyme required for sulfatase activity
MPKIFISYRRADSQDITDRIHEYMVRHFDEQSVFQDVGNIPFGVDFRAYLHQEIDRCDTVLVIIGHDWARIMQERIDQTADIVRIEVEMALQKNKLVIPVLVNDANMPSPPHLPESIHQLCYNNAAKIRPNPDFKRDCEALANSIKQYHKSQVAKQEIMLVTPDFELLDLSNILPEPFEWCFVPAGKVTLTAGGYIPKGEQTFNLGSFYIAKYPITNVQYAQFIEVEGYSRREFWTDAGWQIKENAGWVKQGTEKWLGGNYPAIGISWYEAIAFCNWLSRTLGEQNNTVINLPTEQQWQRAAQGDDGRLYPWGDVYDKHKSNTNESQIDKTTPVTQYAEGQSPFGVIDMSGNVWEWCLTDYESGSQNIDYPSIQRVMRGGSWLDIYQDARNLYRTCDVPTKRSSRYGFRIAVNRKQ